MSAVDDCCLGAVDAVSVEEAWRRLEQVARPRVATENVALREACGRIIAETLVSPRDVPPFDNVAVDGYAFAGASLAPEGRTRLRLMPGRAAAGHPHRLPVPEGCALRVLTGAMLPPGTDTVVMEEEVERDGEWLFVPAGYRPGRNARQRGEDVRAGARLFAAGTRIAPQHVGVAAELGFSELRVYAPLDVAVFSSGDELREPGSPLEPGTIYDANRLMLQAYLSELPVRIHDFGILPDEEGAVRRALSRAARQCQVIVTSGGASRGDEDHLARMLAHEGELHFWRLRMKPGRPLALGRFEGADLIALPGNPVAAAVGFLLFARPLLLAFAGGRFRRPRAVPLEAAFALRKKEGRSEFLRARLVPRPDGSLAVDRIAREGSGILTSMTEADGLVHLGEETVRVEPGERVAFLSFAELCGPR